MVAQNLQLLLFLWVGLGLIAQSQKGVWLTDVASSALDSKARIQEVVQRCKTYGIDQIYVVVWNRGHTPYPSPIMEKEFGKKIATRFANRDMLQELIEVAHADRLKVHAWFEFGFSSSYQEEDGGHYRYTNPLSPIFK